VAFLRNIVAASLLLLLAAGAALAQMPADKIAAAVAQRYGVNVLKVTPTTLGERDAYAVLVMNPGGNDNGAFAVSTLVVDAASGELVPQFAHGPSGYTLPPAPDTATSGSDSGPSIRSLTEREYRQR